MKTIKVVPFVNERNILATRNRKAAEYSRMCELKGMAKRNKRKEAVEETIAAILLCVGMPVLFVLALFV